MKKFIIGAVLGLLGSVGYAQSGEVVNKPVFCSSLKIIIESVSGEFEEMPVWRGNDDKSKYVMMSNSKTGTWTMIQYNDQIACVVGFGFNSRTIFTGKSV